MGQLFGDEVRQWLLGVIKVAEAARWADGIEPVPECIAASSGDPGRIAGFWPI